jgi:pimeloyl-ACP methyl ester carboxylesterase
MGEEIVTDFVLIHGAYQGGWIWKFVSERLRAKGHNVLAPTLDGCGERAAQMRAGITTETHAEEIAKLLYFHDLTNAVLVGTSRQWHGDGVRGRESPRARRPRRLRRCTGAL